MYSYYTIFFFLLFVSPPCLDSCETSLNYTHPWMKFDKFRDAKRGSQINSLSSLKKYFHRFGYIKSQEEPVNFTDMFDAPLEEALSSYQAKLGLPVTGVMDSDTLQEVMSPRCGVSDKYAYFTGQPRWTRSVPMTLTYALSPLNMITSLSKAVIQGALRRAFSHWEVVVPVTFTEVEDYSMADIQIGFYSGDHGDGEPFDGVLGVLAHSFSPESGRFHLDAAETWAVDFRVQKSEIAVDLESIATHEIGHLLGLGHTSVKGTVMYPTLKPREKRVELKIDDIKGVQALYGSNPNFSLQAVSESDMLVNYGNKSRPFSSSMWSVFMILWLCV